MAPARQAGRSLVRLLVVVAACSGRPNGSHREPAPSDTSTVTPSSTGSGRVPRPTFAAPLPCLEVAWASVTDGPSDDRVGGLGLRDDGRVVAGVHLDREGWIGRGRPDAVWIGHDRVGAVVAYERDGAVAWFDLIDTGAFPRPPAVAVDREDQAWAGVQGEVLTFASPAEPSRVAVGGDDVFLVTWDAAGERTRILQIGGEGDESVDAVLADPTDGAIAVVASSSERLTVGVGAGDERVVELEEPYGRVLVAWWSSGLLKMAAPATAFSATEGGAAVLADGSIVLAAWGGAHPDPAEPPLSNTQDAIAGYAPDGALAWTWKLDASVDGVAATPEGVAVVGYSMGSFSARSRGQSYTIDSAGAWEMVLSIEGELLADRRLALGEVRPEALAAGPAGRVVAATCSSDVVVLPDSPEPIAVACHDGRALWIDANATRGTCAVSATIGTQPGAVGVSSTGEIALLAEIDHEVLLPAESKAPYLAQVSDRAALVGTFAVPAPGPPIEAPPRPVVVDPACPTELRWPQPISPRTSSYRDCRGGEPCELGEVCVKNDHRCRLACNTGVCAPGETCERYEYGDQGTHDYTEVWNACDCGGGCVVRDPPVAEGGLDAWSARGLALPGTGAQELAVSGDWLYQATSSAVHRAWLPSADSRGWEDSSVGFPDGPVSGAALAATPRRVFTLGGATGQGSGRRVWSIAVGPDGFGPEWQGEPDLPTGRSSFGVQVAGDWLVATGNESAVLLSAHLTDSRVDEWFSAALPGSVGGSALAVARERLWIMGADGQAWSTELAELPWPERWQQETAHPFVVDPYRSHLVALCDGLVWMDQSGRSQAAPFGPLGLEAWRVTPLLVGARFGPPLVASGPWELTSSTDVELWSTERVER